MTSHLASLFLPSLFINILHHNPNCRDLDASYEHVNAQRLRLVKLEPELFRTTLRVALDLCIYASKALQEKEGRHKTIIQSDYLSIGWPACVVSLIAIDTETFRATCDSEPKPTQTYSFYNFYYDRYLGDCLGWFWRFRKRSEGASSVENEWQSGSNHQFGATGARSSASFREPLEGSIGVGTWKRDLTPFKPEKGLVSLVTCVAQERQSYWEYATFRVAK